MKKRLLSLLLAAGCFAATALAAVLGGSSSDPLISMSYVTGTYLNSVLQETQEKINVVGDEVYESALDYLEDAAMNNIPSSERIPTISGYKHADGFLEMRLKKGDAISGMTGTSVLSLAGTMSVSFSGGAVVNVTTGKTVNSGAYMVNQQRYLTAESSKPKFVVQSDTAVVSVDGYYALQKSSNTDYNELAGALKKMGLFKGKTLDYGSGYALEDKANRIEGLVMFLRMLGKENEALACTSKHPFSDVPAWGNSYVAYAYKNGYTKGVSEQAAIFGTYQEITAREYVTFLLRALGYDDSKGDFAWNTSLDKAGAEGVITVGEKKLLSEHPFYRAQMVYLSYYGLLSERKAGGTLLSHLDAEGALNKAAVEKVMSTVSSRRIT